MILVCIDFFPEKIASNLILIFKGAALCRDPTMDRADSGMDPEAIQLDSEQCLFLHILIYKFVYEYR